MKLIVGLGNPGSEYVNNRHNVGFICLNHFARAHGIRFDRKLGKARIGTGEIDGKQVVLARPQTYMNQSGQAVSQLVKKFSISLDDLVVIHDDLDLPLDKIRLRQGGSAGGHKGVESIIAELGSRSFSRLRVGIGRPSTDTEDIIAYVLSDFTSEERQILTQTIPSVSEAILCLLTEGPEITMNRYN